MRLTPTLRAAAVTVLGAGGILVTGLTPAAHAVAVPDTGAVCLEREAHSDEAVSARGGHGVTDHRPVSLRGQRAIERRTDRRLAALAPAERSEALAAGATIPVYFHVMRDAAGNGDVTDQQIAQQISVMNASFSGAQSSVAADTGFQFSLAGTYRYNNNQWHQDKSSSTYRSQTRKGGANALNVWLVDFKWLGIATFPWDYARQPKIDGIRVHYASLPGGPMQDYNQGGTATHEAGHWFGLYHTFQGGCTSTNDEVGDTPAQNGSTYGCPAGRDSCSLPGLDPIHNYMDYSFDACYDQFTPGQASRADQMWVAYRG